MYACVDFSALKMKDNILISLEFRSPDSIFKKGKVGSYFYMMLDCKQETEKH